MDDLTPTDDGRKPAAEHLARGSSLDETLIKQLDSTMADLDPLLVRGCCCFDDNECEHCIATRIAMKIERVLYPVVRSLHEHRNHGPERVFFEKWLQENKRVRGLNHGWGLLELILSTETRGGLVGGLEPVPATITQRDMDVATAVIQWLGTNCGCSFLRSCEREIDEQRMERQKSQTHTIGLGHEFPAGADRDRVESVCGQVANQCGKSESHRDFIKQQMMKVAGFVRASCELEFLNNEQTQS